MIDSEEKTFELRRKTFVRVTFVSTKEQLVQLVESTLPESQSKARALHETKKFHRRKFRKNCSFTRIQESEVSGDSITLAVLGSQV